MHCWCISSSSSLVIKVFFGEVNGFLIILLPTGCAQCIHRHVAPAGEMWRAAVHFLAKFNPHRCTGGMLDPQKPNVYLISEYKRRRKGRPIPCAIFFNKICSVCGSIMIGLLLSFGDSLKCFQSYSGFTSGVHFPTNFQRPYQPNYVGCENVLSAPCPHPCTDRGWNLLRRSRPILPNRCNASFLSGEKKLKIVTE